MGFALREIRRSTGRFGLLVGAIALLVFLILFQQALQAALLGSFVGAIRNQTAPVLVYSVDGQRLLQASVITPDLEEAVRGVDGVAAVGTLGAGEFSVTAGGELVDATLVGYEDPALGGPADVVDGRLPEAPDEAVASDVDAPDGFAIGDVVTVEPGGLEITVVGLAADAQLNVGPTLFTTSETYAEAVRARNPDARDPLPNALGVAPDEGVDPEVLAERITDAHPSADALTRDAAADATPGVAQVRQSFQIIFGLYAVVVPCVTGLFFLIVTFQKAGALTLLRAIGVGGAALVRSLLFQVALVVTLGFGLGLALYLPLSGRDVGGLALQADPVAIGTWFVALLVLSLASGLLSARRVLRIEPSAATGILGSAS